MRAAVHQTSFERERVCCPSPERQHIGFPGSVEGIRHFRRMLDRAVRKLTAAEVDGLIESLSPKQ